MSLSDRTTPTTIVTKPWGRFVEFTKNTLCTVKILEVKPGEMLSDQRHKNRAELWVHLTDGAIVSINGDHREPQEGKQTWIAQGDWHRLEARPDASGVVKVLEISFGAFDEEDIERREDKYGRAESVEGF